MGLPQDCTSDTETSNPVAIIGLSLNVPQNANCAEEFWNMLINGRSALTEIPPERFNVDAFYHEDAERHDTVCVQEHRHMVAEAY